VSGADLAVKMSLRIRREWDRTGARDRTAPSAEGRPPACRCCATVGALPRAVPGWIYNTFEMRSIADRRVGPERLRKAPTHDDVLLVLRERLEANPDVEGVGGCLLGAGNSSRNLEWASVEQKDDSEPATMRDPPGHAHGEAERIEVVDGGRLEGNPGAHPVGRLDPDREAMGLTTMPHALGPPDCGTEKPRAQE
jgi:hypothetical protein